MTCLEVAVNAPLHHTLTYAPPEKDADLLQPGMRLLVPLGRRKVTGYLLGFSEEAPAGYELRPVVRALDLGPLFPASLVPFFRWIATYYFYPIGEVIRTALPAGLTPKSVHAAVLAPEGEMPIAEWASRQKSVSEWTRRLLDKKVLTPVQTGQVMKIGADRRLLEKWRDQGWITLGETITGGGAVQKTETFAGIKEDTEHLFLEKSLKPSEKKTIAVLRDLGGAAGNALLPLSVILNEYRHARKPLLTLAEKGLVILEERPAYRDIFGDPPPFFSPPETLTDEQQSVLDVILPAIGSGSGKIFLLHGITGSGKTEVYLRAAEKALAQNKTVLVLVPEIALATQLEGHFHSRFGTDVAVLHSGLTRREHLDQWLRLLHGEAKIVIGARSAVFAPITPGLIIVDEEHDGAYKQEDGLRYNGRDLAVLRGTLSKAPVLLGTATPSVTSFHHSRQKKYTLLELTRRIENRPLPAVKIVDLKTLPRMSSGTPLFSHELTVAMGETLAQQNQCLIFLNRRGFANFLLCRSCGHTIQCRSCNISLTLHKGRRELVCHYCGYAVRSDAACPNCLAGDFLNVGSGTERIEEELAALFPKAAIARLDRDTSANRREFLATLRAVRNREIDILVGTQMITKGHHFPHVTLVGIIWADAGLNFPDFRAGERTFQLLSQVIGRAGREEKPGRVIVQTHHPDHYGITTATEHNYPAFFETEIALRRQLSFPPFSRLINLRLEGDKENDVMEAAKWLAEVGDRLSRRHKGIAVLGPAPAPLQRLRGKYRWQILLKGAHPGILHSVCQQLLTEAAASPLAKPVNLSVDVDPENML